jgi:GTP-binding protein Era
MHKFGFVSIVGRPNAGKSSLLNALLKEDLCAVTQLPQTTRQILRGVLSLPEGQIVFVDTPGMHAGRYILNKGMACLVEQSLDPKEIDAVLYMVDLSRECGEEEELIAGLVTGQKNKAILLFNKTDLLPDPNVPFIRFYKQFPQLLNTPAFMICANNLENREEIISHILNLLPEGKEHFSPDFSTDATMRFLASEIIRKQVILNTQEEVPHATCVLIDAWLEEEDKTHIKASIVVETDGQKGILIGKDGKKIKQIRQFSKKEITKMAGTPIAIELFVKVRPGWRNNPGFLKEAGLNLPRKK